MSEDSWSSPAAISEWWASSSQSTITKRSYSAEVVASLRSPFPEVPVGNVQSLKLKKLFSDNMAAKTASFTFGAIDPVVAHVMGEAGFKTLYISGAVCAQTDIPTNDVSADLADYTYDTVPRKVEQIFKSQMLHAKVDRVAKTTPAPDRFIPIIADADSGHGNSTATMKLTKLFVEAGAAGIHLDDLLSGTKKFNPKSKLHVCVPTSELIRRLLAAKLQLDIMGSECVLIQRTDVETCNYISSTVDPRDRNYILGATNKDLPSWIDSMADIHVTAEERNPKIAEWETKANLMTIDEAVKAAATPEQFEAYFKLASTKNIAQSLQIALGQGINVFWDYETCRTTEGWYSFRGCVESAIERSIASAPYVDVVWPCAGLYESKSVQKYAAEIQKALPGKWMAYNFSGDFSENNPTDKEIKNIVPKTASLGYSWIFCPMHGMWGEAVGTAKFAKAMYEDTLLGFLDEGLRPGMKAGVSVLGWYGATGKLADVHTNAIEL